MKPIVLTLSAADYRRKAGECRQRADLSQDAWTRDTLLRAASEWQELAEKKSASAFKGNLKERVADIFAETGRPNNGEPLHELRRAWRRVEGPMKAQGR